MNVGCHEVEATSWVTTDLVDPGFIINHSKLLVDSVCICHVGLEVVGESKALMEGANAHQVVHVDVVGDEILHFTVAQNLILDVIEKLEALFEWYNGKGIIWVGSVQHWVQAGVSLVLETNHANLSVEAVVAHECLLEGVVL